MTRPEKTPIFPLSFKRPNKGNTMRVLLTGAAGFVGRPALDLLKKNHQVTAFDIRPVEGHDQTIVGDVRDLGSVEAAMADHDAVINTIMAPNPSYADGGPGFTINTSGMFNLLDTAQRLGVKRFVHTSSGAVHTGYPQDTRLTHDLYPLKAAGPYALSKLLQEELARNFHEQHDLSIACIRPWSIIDTQRMVTTDGKAFKDFSWGCIDRHDVASSLVCALEKSDIAYECFYVMATPGGYRRTDTARTEERLGWRAQHQYEVED
jgi:nucleoside-diphosphate-sugar epimerase